MELTLPEDQLLPSLISCRLFDSTQGPLVAGHRTRTRTTQSYEFSIYLTEGGSLCLPDGDHSIHPGLCRLIPPGVRISSIPHYQSYTVYFTLAPEVDGKFPHCRNPFLDSIPLCYDSRMPDAYMPLLEKLSASAFESGVGSVITTRTALFQLLSLIHRDVSSGSTGSAAHCAVEKARRYMEQNLSRDISLEALGELTGYHPLYLQRVFRQITGSTPHAFLTQLRLQKAREMLTLTSLPVSQISAACGYGCVSHFNNLFKRQTGCSPLVFRKRTQILP